MARDLADGGTRRVHGSVMLILRAVRIDVLVPRLQPRNTLPPRLLPREIATGGRSLQGSAFQGWSLGTRIGRGLILFYHR